MSKINTIIEDFSTTNLIAFLRASIPSFKPDDEDLDHLFQEDIFDKYESIVKIGEAKIDKDDLIVIASKTNEPLTERTGKKNQYEIAKTILKHEVKDASLFVFYDDEGNFRFSFVKANYLGTKRDFTDFKRYTYFVTPSQTNKTFIKQVGGCNFNSLDEIIQAFSVEPLNKQFYQDIAKSFYCLIGGKVKIGSRNEEFDTSLKLPSTPVDTNRKIYQEFAVRLIGRTIFCWFLKSKKSENSVPLVPESWLSSKTVVEINNEQHNYYHSVLEKLFFLVLNKKQKDRKHYELPNEHELIPFLNGGLFEAQTDDFFPTNSKGIHQIAYDLNIPNQWFIELFEVLEQYNFTIDENSIYDAEVSIDPEMLGTIFENLLAEIDPDTEKSARKATGSFYTPREIVDYMVEQSLVQYLKTKVDTENEEQLLELFKEGGENKFEPTETKNILEALSDVKILDPACGSGAFPMGALHKIINALQKLDPDASWWKQKQIENVPNALAKQMLKEKLDGESADYVRKLGVIQNSIYGVDIQPIASEISKLRSFLSLVIDETIIDDAENRGIKALPNLEFKFVTANALIGLDNGSVHQTLTIDFGETEVLQDELKDIRNRYLQAYGNEKIDLKKEFEKVQLAILKKEIKGDIKSKKAIQLASWKPFNNEPNYWFDSFWMFGVEKFDIIVGNPPYIGEKGNEKPFHLIKNTNLHNRFYSRWMDYFYYFFHLGLDLLKTDGVLSFITTNYYFTSTGGVKLRSDIKKRSTIRKIINFNTASIFETAKGQHNAVTILTRGKSQNPSANIVCKTTNNKNKLDFFKIFSGLSENAELFYVEQQDLFEGTDNQIRLAGQGDEHNINTIEDVLNKIKNNSSELLGNIANITMGIVTLSDTLSRSHFKKFPNIQGEVGDGIYVLTDEELKKAKLQGNKFIKPFYKNSDIRKYDTEKENKLWVIYIKDEGLPIKLTKELLNHFERFKTLIVGLKENFLKNKIAGQIVSKWFSRGNYFVLFTPKKEEYFNSEKIVAPYRAKENIFAYNNLDFFASKDVCFILPKSSNYPLKYILGILNSRLIFKWLYHKGKRKGETLELYKKPLSDIPIAHNKNSKYLINIVDGILKFKNEDKSTSELEFQLNIIVYKIYNLNHQEVKIIDPDFPLTQEAYDNYQID